AYTPAEMIPVVAGGITLAAVERAFQWVIVNRIADKDRATGALVSRTMVRDEVRRNTGGKFGKRTGNPALKSHPKDDEATTATITNEIENSATLKGRVKPEGGYPSGYTTDPEPDPEPDPVLPSNPVDTSSPDNLADAEKTRVGQRDLAHDTFAVEFERHLGTKYVSKSGDFVRLAALRKANKIGTKAAPDGWDVACSNYFASPLRTWTLADLTERFATFKNSPVDRFGTPIDHANGGKNATRTESAAEAKQRRNVEAAQRILDRRSVKDRGSDVG